MNSEFLLNDTFDNFNFTQSEKYLALSSQFKTTNDVLPRKIEFKKPVNSNVEVTFDDSMFLSDSWAKELDQFQNVSRERVANISIKPTITEIENQLVDGITIRKSSRLYEDHVEERERRQSENRVVEIEIGTTLSNESSDDSLFSTSADEVTECENVSKIQNVICTENVIYNNEETQPTEAECQNQSIKNRSIQEGTKTIKNSCVISSQPDSSMYKQDSNIECKEISSLGLPAAILEKYESRNLFEMFQWQVECLNKKDVLENGRNFVYSAPTSAGKTLVAEILAIKTVLERKKKVIFILPFVSIVREKMFYFQDLLGSSGIRVEGFMGSYNPPGGFSSIQFAICTIEKANSLINRLMEEDKLSDIGAVVVDEMHLLGDSSRGYLLELLLTKLRYISKKNDNVKIQIISMSATLPNLDLLSKWLDAELYTTNFRPIPLHEQAIVAGVIYDKDLKPTRKLESLPDLGVDTDNILQLCLETIKDSSSVLIFCPTKNWCENLAQQISTAFHKLGSSNSENGELLRSQLNGNLIKELLQQLRYCPIGLDEILKKTVSFGVAFHHAGLTMDERDIIEGGFRTGALRVLIATSTLSSGVNLPARRVIIRTPNFHGKPIDTLTYRQMIGRAGRMGKDTVGESFLICQKNDYNVAKDLMSAQLRPVKSCLEGAGKLKRALLEVIASGVASSPRDIDLFTNCTLLAVESIENSDEDLSNPIDDAVTFLKNNEFIRLQKLDDGEEIFVATSLGKACLSSSMAPDEGLALFTELEKARQCFVLESELHLIYLVTPYSACNSWGNIDWMFYLELWERLPKCMKRVGELVGICESYIINAARVRILTNTNKLYHKMLVHKRFFVALALQDLVNEKPLATVCRKFNCNRGMLQSLQQSASSFAGMVTAFSRQLGWSSVELLISQFQDRLQFGVSRDLLDLMHLPILNGKVARILYNSGIETLVQLANSKVCDIENILYKAIPFESEKGREGETEFDKNRRNKFRNVWVTGKEGLTELEAADILVTEARKYLQLEMGLAEAKWDTSSNNEPMVDSGGNAEVEKNGIVEVKVSQVKSTSFLLENHAKMEQLVDSVDISAVDRCGLVEEEVSQLENAVILPEMNLQNEVESNINRKTNSSIVDSRESSLVESVSANDLNISHSSSTLSKPESTKIEDFDEDLSKSPSAVFDNNNRAKDPNLNDFTGNFTNIDFTSIEADYEDDAKTNNITTRLSKVSLKNEISHCLSPSTEINISGSTIFSRDSSSEKICDDISFDESFTLKLSHSDQSTDSGIKGDINVKLTDNKMLDEAFASSFTANACADDDLVLETSVEDEETTTKKRKGRHRESGTPSKKHKKTGSSKKREKHQRTPSDEPPKIETKRVHSEDFHSSYVDYKDSCDFSVPSDLKEMKIIDVCKDISLFNLFSKEIKLQKSISISLACSRIEVNGPTIGSSKPKAPNFDVYPFIYKKCKLHGFSLAWGYNIVYYLSLEKSELSHKVIKLLKSILGSKNQRIRMFESKEQIKMMDRCCQLKFNAKIDDPRVIEWILDPEFTELNLTAMCLKYCPEGVELSQLVSHCKGIGSIGLSLDSSVDPKIRASIECLLIWHIMGNLKISLEDNNKCLNIYENETDILACLAKMEIHGFPCNNGLLKKLEVNLKTQMANIEKKAFYLAGRTFNFVSSASVAKVLGMNKDRKSSTRKKVLEQNKNPISDMIIQWRKINTILTKVIYPFLRLIENDRIRGCYITATSTGRISMHEPNLQNVAKEFLVKHPFTDESISINCRSAFAVPEGYTLVSADYCQIELRVLTHFSEDAVLTNIMRKPGDVFRLIAAKWNHVVEDKVDESMRQNTKHLCYGIIYGMGAKALSEQLSIEEEEAIEFKESFMNTYPAIQIFVRNTIEYCKNNGYVETLTGRRRYLAHINEQDCTRRSQAERQAVNTVIQGSAADITKKAMLAIECELQEIFCKTKNSPKLVLHLHDELIYEVPDKYVKKVAKVIKKNMEKAVQLSIPFPVKLRTGKSWGTMTEYNL